MKDSPFWGANAELTEREHVILAAYTNRRNIHSALAWIAPHTFADLGFETACQVHGNLARLTCGCEVHYVFDHHLRTRPHAYARFELRPFRAPKVCARHQPINDMDALFDAASKSGGKDPAGAADGAWANGARGIDDGHTVTAEVSIPLSAPPAPARPQPGAGASTEEHAP